MGSRPVKTEQIDMESFFDFSQGTTQPSPAATSSSKTDTTSKAASQGWDSVSSFSQADEPQQFSGPSHDYHQYKQQVGLPMGSVSNMPSMNHSQGMFDGYNSGIGDMVMDGAWSTGIDMDADINMDFNNLESGMPAMFFPQQATESRPDNFINPTTIGGHEEPVSNVGRLWPGMHSQQAQQAALQKAAQGGALPQRHMKMQPHHQQQQQPRQATNAAQAQNASSSHPGHAKRAPLPTDPQVEERISRLLSQMRQNSTANLDEDGSPDSYPHNGRLKRDDEDMDDDERLLASEEGKKLSSKERRQLRNKVSARAFRSRRKEYIGQLEGEVALKAQEAATLRTENDALVQENERYRGFIETILRHPAFMPFMNDVSKDPSILGLPQTHPMQSQRKPQQQVQPTPTPQPQQPQQPQSPEDTKPEFLNFDASQLQIPSQNQNERVGMATIPENDFSKLNINSFQAMKFNNFNSVNAFALTELPDGPDLVDVLQNPNFSPLDTSACNLIDTSVGQSDGRLISSLLLAKLESAAIRTQPSLETFI